MNSEGLSYGQPTNTMICEKWLSAISGVDQNMVPSCYLGEPCYRHANWGPSTDVRASITLEFSPTYNTMADSVLKKMTRTVPRPLEASWYP